MISPWNFPVAIPCGMTAAGLATGNAVVLKPAEQSPGCAVHARAGAARGRRAARRAGAAARARATSARRSSPTRACTRSRSPAPAPVGLEIVRRAAETPPGQNHLKRVVAEMGGKNCVIVDSDADLDDVVPALREVRVQLRRPEVLGGRARARARGDPRRAGRAAGRRDRGARRSARPTTSTIDVPPVIERAAQERVERYARAGRGDRARRRPRPRARPQHGWFATPTLATDLPARLAGAAARRSSGRCWRSSASRSIEEACDRVDASPFALTGGLFSRNPRTVDYVADRSPVGNLYVNREITGAMVGRQPFGGNRLSGTGTKAGGPGYLLHFVEPRVVTENTVRHGLVV